ncbi:hypothetical protein C8J35_11634 [Rhizobium sp. PP-F2F-G38]|nr:hypothetical protein C8J35_11634 [Rhizobium sp. PP-F2F-G38]
MTEETVIYRHLIERQIVTLLADTVLAAGNQVEIDNGGGDNDIEPLPSGDREAIVQSLLATNHERIYVFAADGGRLGWST